MLGLCPQCESGHKAKVAVVGGGLLYSITGLGLALVATFVIWAWTRRSKQEKAGQGPRKRELATTKRVPETDISLGRAEEPASIDTHSAAVNDESSERQLSQGPQGVPDLSPPVEECVVEAHELLAAHPEPAEAKAAEYLASSDANTSLAPSAPEVKGDNAKQLQGTAHASSALDEDSKSDSAELSVVRTRLELESSQPPGTGADNMHKPQAMLIEPPVQTGTTVVQTEPPDSHFISELEANIEQVSTPLQPAAVLEQESEPEREMGSTQLTEEGSKTENLAEYQAETDQVHRPARYRPPRVTPLKPRQGEPQKARLAEREQMLELRLQANPDRHDFCMFRVLAQRPESSPPETEARWGDRTVTFIESSDDWYEVIVESNLAAWLADGVVLAEKRRGGARLRWELSSHREIHVLAGQEGFAGFVSTTRLCIGRKHLVLCRASRASEVAEVLADSGCGLLSARQEEFGSPPGWVFFWPVIPQHALAPVSGDDILNLLRPQPDVELLLEGGLRLQDSTWLAGYPPQVRLSGVLPTESEVYIDGQPAQITEDGSFVIPGCDQPGDHVVWCVGKSRKYSISKPEGAWEIWEPYTFRRGSICGVSASPFNTSLPPVTVPATNPVLLGAEPGQVFLCPAGVGREWTGFVPFQVVWALPADPLHCDRTTSRVMLVTPLSPLRSPVATTRRSTAASARWRWCQTIRDCRKKGLTVSPSDPQTEALWAAYAAQARAIWKRLK